MACRPRRRELACRPRRRELACRPRRRELACRPSAGVGSPTEAAGVGLPTEAAGVGSPTEAAGVGLPTEADAASLGLDLLQGEETGTGLALAVSAEVALPDPLVVLGLREVYGALGEDGFMAAGAATQVLEWVATHRYCGRCATPTERVPDERCMRCPSCGLLRIRGLRRRSSSWSGGGKKRSLRAGRGSRCLFSARSRASWRSARRWSRRCRARSVRRWDRGRGRSLLREPTLAFPAFAHGRFHGAMGERGHSLRRRARSSRPAGTARRASGNSAAPEYRPPAHRRLAQERGDWFELIECAACAPSLPSLLWPRRFRWRPPQVRRTRTPGLGAIRRCTSM